MDIAQALIIAIGYIFTLGASGPVVLHFISPPVQEPRTESDKTKYDLGAIIGKCENLLTLTLILAGAYTGLALIFTAKSIVRSEQMKTDPKYYLGGTLVNFTFSVLMGFAIRVVLILLSHPL